MAPFLESRAYAASVGATNEFRKMEWVAVDPVNNRVYWAMSEVSKGMTDGEGAINVEENLCGIVYAGDLDAENNITKLPLHRRRPLQRRRPGQPLRCEQHL